MDAPARGGMSGLGRDRMPMPSPCTMSMCPPWGHGYIPQTACKNDGDQSEVLHPRTTSGKVVAHGGQRFMRVEGKKQVVCAAMDARGRKARIQIARGVAQQVQGKYAVTVRERQGSTPCDGCMTTKGDFRFG